MATVANLRANTKLAVAANPTVVIKTATTRLSASIFASDQDIPTPGTEVNEIIPGSEGGLIEAVKRAVILALRDALLKTNITVDGDPVYVDLEYPMKKEQYPGVWVQFSFTKLNRAGISHEVWVKDDQENWTPIQEWMFNGRVTLTIVALRSRERDRIADTIINMLAFARTPDLVITKPNADTKQYRQLLTALTENPYVAMALNTDVITPGGQSASMDVPWQADVLAYEDNYSFDIIGNFNIQFNNDGVYTLSRVDHLPVMETSTDFPRWRTI